MKEFWSERIRDMVPYVPGEQPKGGGFIKLNTNENPYPPSSLALAAMWSAAGAQLRLYPDPECTDLRRAAARYYGVGEDHIFCGNGSDEILAFCFQAFFDPGRPVCFADVTYSFYPVYAGYFGLDTRIIPLREDFSLPVEAFFDTPGGAVIANPNAPTGQAVGLDSLRQILEHNRERVVVVDEAYVDFGGVSAVPLIDEYPNLVVVHTLSKSRSLAGLRVGFALAQPNLIAALRCVRDSINSYTVDRLAQAGAAAALGDTAYFAQTRQKVMATRARCARELEELGFTVSPSCANFLFVRHPQREGKELFAALREKGILVRRWDAPRIDQWLRISIGTDKEMDTLCQTLKGILAGD